MFVFLIILFPLWEIDLPSVVILLFLFSNRLVYIFKNFIVEGLSANRWKHWRGLIFLLSFISPLFIIYTFFSSDDAFFILVIEHGMSRTDPASILKVRIVNKSDGFYLQFCHCLFLKDSLFFNFFFRIVFVVVNIRVLKKLWLAWLWACRIDYCARLNSLTFILKYSICSLILIIARQSLLYLF